MKIRYLGLALLGGGVAWAAAGQIGPGSKPAIEFSKPGLPPLAMVDLRPTLSPVNIVVPVDLKPLAARVEQALPATLANTQDLPPDASCSGKRAATAACALIDGTVVRSGPTELKVSVTAVRISVPVKYSVQTSGAAERQDGNAKIDLAFTIATGATGGIEVSRAEIQVGDDAGSILRTNARLWRQLDAQLKPVAKVAEDDLRRTLATLPIKAATLRSWDVLAQPLELGKGSGFWLRSSPDAYSSGALVASGNMIGFQVPVAAHLAIVEGERSQAGNNARRVALQSQDAAPPGPSKVRLALPVDLEVMRQQAEAAFSRAGVFESRADSFSQPVKVKVRGTRLYPALRQIGLALDVEVTTAKGAVHTGILNLAGRPVLDAATSTVTLADVTFPAVAGKEMNQQNGIPRLDPEPFAQIFAAAAKLDISRVASEAMPRVRQMLSQSLANDLSLQSNLTQVVPMSVEVTRDGLWLIVDVEGDVAIVYDGPRDMAALGTSNAGEGRPSVPVGPEALVSEPGSNRRAAKVSGVHHRASVSAHRTAPGAAVAHAAPTKRSGQVAQAAPAHAPAPQIVLGLQR